MKQNDAPFSLAGLFVDSDDENTLLTEDNLYQYESQDLLFGDLSIQVTQSAFHPTNANKVWPGTYILVDYMLSNWTRLFESDKIRLPATTTTLLAPTDASCTLELGAATGALSIFLKLKGVNVITSDYDDGGQIENSILHNMAQNGTRSTLHIPHSWGTSWHESFSAATKRQLLTVTAPDTTPTDSIPRPKFACKLIVASDILLYVSAYAALVDTLLTLFRDCGAQEFLMAWNRRIADSAQFFALMRSAGFTHSHHGKGVHSFFLCEDFGRTPAEGEKEEPPREDGSAKAMSSSINDLPTLFDP